MGYCRTGEELPSLRPPGNWTPFAPEWLYMHLRPHIGLLATTVEGSACSTLSPEASNCLELHSNRREEILGDCGSQFCT